MEQLSGIEFCQHIIDHICLLKWAPSVVLGTLQSLRDLQLKPEHLQKCILKVFSSITDLPFQNLPSLSYQLLLLAAKVYVLFWFYLI